MCELQLRRLASKAGLRRRIAPHQLRHADAVEMARQGVPLDVIQRQLGHANLGVTSIYRVRPERERLVAPALTHSRTVVLELEQDAAVLSGQEHHFAISSASDNDPQRRAFAR